MKDELVRIKNMCNEAGMMFMIFGETYQLTCLHEEREYNYADVSDALKHLELKINYINEVNLLTKEK